MGGLKILEVARINATDVKAKKTTQYQVLFSTAVVEGFIAEMNRRGIEECELLKGMVMIVSRPEPAPNGV